LVAVARGAVLLGAEDPAEHAGCGVRGGCLYVTRSTTSETLAELAALVAAGELDVHITGRYPLAHAAEALALVESGHAKGKLVLEVS
ncbi:zinc-binding dehydrogenase, partial [Kitasatospora sp. NPDC093558]|uniref:zinc-binding dehydrogenase n=1 Tax=Kitasatospora sp. NPDC093558 TaxID=3155201 RepID=UPI003444C853